ncbi:MAG: hypothetical protein AVDCRST_MAG96-1293 [uncultured Segetibacter sp.]|uniref:Ppx/GppA phosphatase domain-containing protein n=1 Tax=uncultured Segetibacter sp. TaxID=481133 RepID=A0A6J4S1F8_9BACT|nr:MAG: hypothetical protein AVDCRST_MAG96-1293 [uncultured Segetibacter sp.]
MKLKPGGKIAIFLILGVIAFFLIKRYLPQNNAADTQVSTTTAGGSEGNTASDNTASNAGSGQTPSDNNTARTESRTFDYTPEKPVNGKLRGVVEVGATGFNSFVINMDAQKRWEIVSKDFGESLAYEGLATTEDIRAGLKKYLSQMFEKGVPKNDMHFVVSSGAQKEPKTTIISNELKKMGYVVNLVNPAQEGKYALQATVPPSFQDNSFLVDVGSGNTKVSWQEGANLKALELPGAKYYEHGTSDDAVYNEVKGQAAKIPEGKRNVGFIIGGVPFTLAKQARNGNERYTVLNAPGSYKATDKKMASGLNIYKGIAEVTKTDTFVFDWDANFTIGFLLNLR